MNISDRIYRNVKALAAINGMNMKDVETGAGLYPGYFARKRKNIGVEALVNVSGVFEVSMNDLMEGDYERELEKKKALEKLAEAVSGAAEFFNEDGILNYAANVVRNLRKEDG